MFITQHFNSPTRDIDNYDEFIQSGGERLVGNVGPFSE